MRTTMPPAAVGLLVLGATLAAQQSPPVFRTETQAVLITATVVDREGRAVTDLRREDCVCSRTMRRRRSRSFIQTRRRR